ncbi:permease [Paenibacillus oryzae]|uniref:Permease n=1 Tax=Paenibacillus oryzae TaxID=1844972 RepID=A0A1A5YFH9_9BACL|nr:permease [Paenibacillus oryzae]OBR64386.1 permease [Paenibacillus oryzae]
MQQKLLLRLGIPTLAAGCLMMAALILTSGSLPGALLRLTEPANLQSFKILFISIILEAFPFILLGVIFSALLQAFVTDETIKKWTPKNPVAGVLFGGLLGIAFPLCECGMIPVVRRLIAKGMPAYIGIVYLLAGPIVNPVVFASTYSAFRLSPGIAYSRMAVAFTVAVIIGLILSKWMKKSPLKHNESLVAHSPGHPGSRTRHIHEENGAGSSRSHVHSVQTAAKGRWRSKLTSVLSHSSDEFFEMGKYLIFGALLTAIIQTAVDRSALALFSDQPILSYMFMMGFAFILSICSTSDAFIAASFSSLFQPGPLISFLVFGAMIDFKNTLMLLTTFKLKIVLLLIALTSVLTMAAAAIAEAFI